MMRHVLALGLMAALLVATVGCASITGSTNYAAVAQQTGLQNITTGDGTFENYKATGNYSSTEVGIGVGLPFVTTIFELFPAQTNESLLADVASAARDAGGNALINVKPQKSFFSGFPFFFVGIYVDRAEGTGIKTK